MYKKCKSLEFEAHWMTRIDKFLYLSVEKTLNESHTRSGSFNYLLDE